MNHAQRASTLICLRHAHSTNVELGVSGSVPDAELTTQGEQQAAAVALALARSRATHVYTSAARRAHRTGAVISERLALPISTCGLLGETHLGELDGQASLDLRRRTSALLHRWIVERDLSARIADGESGHQVLERMQCALESIATRHFGQTVIVVGHIGSMTTAIAHLTSLETRVWGTPLPHAMPFTLEWIEGRFASLGWSNSGP